jgi:hypothetical protein
MKASSVQEIKQELKSVNQSRLIDICIRLARYRKENKELISFLLFEADDMEAYRLKVKELISEEFQSINSSNHFFAKKGIRRVLRQANRFIKYSGCKETEVALLIHFCQCWKDARIEMNRSNVLSNIYQSQQKKIFSALATLHEDLQHDYISAISKLEGKGEEKEKEKEKGKGKEKQEHNGKPARVISFLGLKIV